MKIQDGGKDSLTFLDQATQMGGRRGEKLLEHQTGLSSSHFHHHYLSFLQLFDQLHLEHYGGLAMQLLVRKLSPDERHRKT